SDADDIICDGATVTFTATPSGAANYDFLVNGASAQSSASRTFTTSALNNGDVVSVIITSAAGCSGTSAGMPVQVDAVPAAAEAGPAQDLCNTTDFLMAAAAASPGTATGAWSFVGADHGASIDDVTSPTTLVRDVPAGQSVTLRWTVTNGVCSSFDDVVLINRATPPVADAGLAQTLCNNPIFTLAGNAAGVGTGLWTIDAGTADITNPASPTTTVTGVPVGTSVTLRWTISNGPCSTSDVVVLTNSAPPVAAEAGPAQDLCNTTDFLMAADAASPGTATGAWSFVGADHGASIDDVTSPTTLVRDVPAGQSVTLRWTVTNGVCSSFDDVVLINRATPPVADAGLAQTLCNNPIFTLAGNAAGVGTGLWTIDAGTADITNPASPTTTVTGVPVGTSVTLRWTISNGPCSTSDVVVLTNSAPPVAAEAGPAQDLCNTTDFLMAADAASPGTATGAWSFVGADHGASIDDVTSPTTLVRDVPAGQSVTLRWTVTNGVCSSFDDVVLINRATPPVADAGLAQTLCNNPIFTLAGNAAGVGTGLWTIDAGTADITNPASPTTTVTGVPVGTSVTLRWTISNGPCSTSDVVVLTNSAPPVAAEAGPAQDLCNTTDFLMAADAASPGTATGAWSFVGADHGASIDDVTSPTTLVRDVPAGQSVTLRWTVTNGACSSFDDVVLINRATPPVADAGLAQTLCNNPIFTLAGNAAGVGTGLWTIDAGTADITNPASPTTTVTGVPVGTSVTLRWTISNGPCSTSDVVVLTNSAPPVAAEAGPAQDLCNTTDFLMAADAASPGTATGAWSFVGADHGAS